ncbi:hypothetical protein PENSPDRAFT_693667 [Peniophora sp. CONT]|nr:hypothetical protein PENSPDRAFT_693667 [Peniophora sp. CONT]
MSGDISMAGNSEGGNSNDIPGGDSNDGSSESSNSQTPLGGMRAAIEAMSRELAQQGIFVAGTNADMAWVRRSVAAQSGVLDALQEGVAGLEMVLRDEARTIDATSRRGFEQLETMMKARSEQAIKNEAELTDSLQRFADWIHERLQQRDHPPSDPNARGPGAGGAGAGAGAGIAA